MAIWINEDLGHRVKDFVSKTWPEKRVRCNNEWIQVSTPIRDMGIHYELYCGRIQFHIEDKFTNEEHKPFLNYLRENVKSDGRFRWCRWHGMDKGLCEINVNIEDWDDLTENLTEIISVFDPAIISYLDSNPGYKPDSREMDVVPSLTYVIKEDDYHAPEPELKTVGQIEFDKLSIPPYQRPYKWNVKNVNQLISDIIAFRNKKQYRLGTLVLHKGEIVDGQQRMITLALLIKRMYSLLKNERKRDIYKPFISKLESFAARTKFPNKYSLHNIVENIHAIEDRESDFDENLFDFVMTKCEFVVIELGDISEAFQFFDSQNARGKDLEAHDLLKAYHLREITTMTTEDSANINEWQLQKTDFLKEIFLTLYRAKRWSQGKTARYFTKNRIDTFKGISLRDGKRYPFYQMEIIAHIFSTIYANDPLRTIDQNKIEYPFNLDDQIINGSRFFDLIRYYIVLYNDVCKMTMLDENSRAAEIIKCIDSYKSRRRTGDQYVRGMFNTLLLYYIDRFGDVELEKVIPKFFVWAYTLRLKSPAVKLASIDNYAKDEESMLRRVHEAMTPYDIINISQTSIYQKEVACSGCDAIIYQFKQLKKCY